MKRRNPQSWTIVLVLAVFLLVLSLGGGSLRSSFYLISRPLHGLFDGLGRGSSSWLDYFQNQRILRLERDALLAEKTLLLAKLAAEDQCAAERDALSEMLEVSRREDDWRKVMGRVTYVVPSQDWILLDVGRRDDLKEGDPVVSSSGSLIGRISQIYERYAEVSLLSRADSLVKVRTIGEPTAVGFIQGEGAMKIGLESTDISQPFERGDDLVTDAFRDEYPSNLPVGQIRSIEKDDVRSRLKATIVPFYQLDDLEIVFVIADF